VADWNGDMFTSSKWLHHGSSCSLPRAMDYRIVSCDITSSCQSATASKIVALLFTSLAYANNALSNTKTLLFIYQIIFNFNLLLCRSKQQKVIKLRLLLWLFYFISVRLKKNCLNKHYKHVNNCKILIKQNRIK